jgi:hypothetical protein
MSQAHHSFNCCAWDNGGHLDTRYIGGPIIGKSGKLGKDLFALSDKYRHRENLQEEKEQKKNKVKNYIQLILTMCPNCRKYTSAEHHHYYRTVRSFYSSTVYLVPSNTDLTWVVLYSLKP